MNDHKIALILVDFQKDFCKGGALEVKEADSLLPLLNSVKKNSKFDMVILTKDWHPQNHCSFQSNNPGSTLYQPFLLPKTQQLQVMWPDHCVQGSKGAELHKDLNVEPSDIIVCKGKLEEVDSYSSFGHAPEDTGLNDILKSNGVRTVYCIGLGFDYCLGNTALDADRYGYETYLVRDGTKSVSLESEKEMEKLLQESTVKIITSDQI